jgi:hypothetical protein
MQSTVPCTFDRRHRSTFKPTCVCSSAEPHLIHTLLHACDRMYRTLYVRSHTQAYVRTHLRLFERRPPSHTHTLAHMRSNVPRTIDRVHRPTFKLTCVCSSADPHLTHTLLHTYDRTRSIACILSPHVTLLGHLFPSSPSFSPLAIQTPPPPPHFSLISIAPKHPTIIPPPPTSFYHHHIVTAPPPAIPSLPFPFFPHFLSTPKTPKFHIFSSIFYHSRAQIHSRIVPLVCCVGFL